MATIGEGLASFGRNFAAGRAEQARREESRLRRDEDLKFRNEELAYRKKVREEDKAFRDEGRRLENEKLIKADEEHGAKVDVFRQLLTKGGGQAAVTRLVGVEPTGVDELSLQGLQGEPAETGFPELEPLTETVTEQVPVEGLLDSEKLSKALAPQRRDTATKKQTRLDRLVNSELDAQLPKVMSGGKRDRKETDASIEARSELKNRLLAEVQAVASGGPLTEEVTSERVVEEGPVEGPVVGPTEAEMRLEEAMNAPLQGPKAQEVVTEAVEDKTLLERFPGVEALSQIQGLENLSPQGFNEVVNFVKQQEVGAIDIANKNLSIQEKTERIKSIPVNRAYTEAQTQKVLRDFGMPATMKVTESASKEIGFLNRMLEAKRVMGQSLLPDESGDTFDPTSSWNRALRVLPNEMSNQQRQAYEASKQTWISGVLRKDSGAAVPESEQEIYGNMYFPQPGDDESVVAAKEALRNTTENSMRGVLTAQGLGSLVIDPSDPQGMGKAISSGVPVTRGGTGGNISLDKDGNIGITSDGTTVPVKSKADILLAVKEGRISRENAKHLWTVAQSSNWGNKLAE